MVGDAFVPPKVFWGFRRRRADRRGAGWCSAFGAAAWRCGRPPATRRPPTRWASTCRAFSLAWDGGGHDRGGLRHHRRRHVAASPQHGVFGLSVLVVVIVGGLDSCSARWSAASFIGTVGRRRRRLPRRRIQAAGHLHVCWSWCCMVRPTACSAPRNRERRFECASEPHAPATARRGAVRPAAPARLAGDGAVRAGRFPSCRATTGSTWPAWSHQHRQCHGLNILTGYTGLVSLGQAAFMGWAPTPPSCRQAGRACSSTCSPAAVSPCWRAGGGLPSLRVKGLYLGHRHHRRLVHRALPVRQLEGWHRRPGACRRRPVLGVSSTPRSACTGCSCRSRC